MQENVDNRVACIWRKGGKCDIRTGRRLLLDRELQRNVNTLQQLNILSRKQTKYCRKLTRSNKIRKQERIYFRAWTAT